MVTRGRAVDCVALGVELALDELESLSVDSPVQRALASPMQQSVHAECNKSGNSSQACSAG